MRVDIKLDGVEKIVKALDPAIYHKANIRTTKEMGRAFRTKSTKMVREEYTVAAKDLKKQIKTQFKYTATEGYHYRFYVGGRTINLIHFGARQLKRGGVSVRAIKRGGSRIKLRHAFIARDSGGRERVFIRKPGVARLPVEGVSTLSVPQMFNDRIVKESLDEVRRKWPSRLSHNIDYYLGKIK